MTYMLARCALKGKDYRNNIDKTLRFCAKSITKSVFDKSGREKYKISYNCYEPGVNRQGLGFEIHCVANMTLNDAPLKSYRYLTEGENTMESIEKEFDALHAYVSKQ